MKEPHAVVFPIPLQGHINPMMKLAKYLNSSGIRVTFMVTEKTLSILRTNNAKDGNNSTPTNESSISCEYNNGIDHHNIAGVAPIHFETLPDCSSSAHNDPIPTTSSVMLFLNSTPMLRGRLEEILLRLDTWHHCPATCIISDSFVPWTQDVANKFGIPRIEFWSSSATVYSMGYHIPQLMDRGYLPIQPGVDQDSCIDMIPGLTKFRLADFFYDSNPHAMVSTTFHHIRMAFSRAKEAHRVIVNSFYALEKDIIDALCHEGVPIAPVGPLLPISCLHKGARDERALSTSLYAEDRDCIKWLDAKADLSVVYVSFGSIASISIPEMQELILGLEASEQPYLLVIRPGIVPQESIHGCCSHVKGRICPWVPQIDVLGHPAVGGFLTHCGWNSTMEGMWAGVPMIGCPRETEQHTNLRCLRDQWRVAMAIDGGGRSSNGKVEIKRELVERAIRALMRGEEGSILREHVKGLQRAAHLAARKSFALESLVDDIQRNFYTSSN